MGTEHIEQVRQFPNRSNLAKGEGRLFDDQFSVLIGHHQHGVLTTNLLAGQPGPPKAGY